MAIGKQCSSLIVDGSGLVWGVCIALTQFSDSGGSLSSGALVWVAIDCHSTFAFPWAEVSVVVGSLGTGGGILVMAWAVEMAMFVWELALAVVVTICVMVLMEVGVVIWMLVSVAMLAMTSVCTLVQ